MVVGKGTARNKWADDELIYRTEDKKKKKQYAIRLHGHDKK